LDRQRNPEILNRLRVDNIVKDKIVSKEAVRSPLADGRNPTTETRFPVAISGTVVYGKNKTKIQRPTTLRALIEQFLRSKT
jgi:hypothetical protein